MTFHSTLSTCRFCKETSYDGEGMVKYGVRHYAHFKCYLVAEKPLADLHVWQVKNFPHRLLKEFGQLPEVNRLCGEKVFVVGENIRAA